MDVKLAVLVLMCLQCCSGALIVPEELSSLLSVVYANIPPINKGTDSRVGFGYAFGNHADFQVVLELGPQQKTGAYGEPFSTTGTNAKREVQLSPETLKKLSQSESGMYLLKWSQNMRKGIKPLHEKQEAPTEVPNLEDSLVELEKNENGEVEIKQPPPAFMPPQVLSQLKQLYGYKVEAEKPKPPKERTEEEIKKIKADLSNVDLDD